MVQMLICRIAQCQLLKHSHRNHLFFQYHSHYRHQLNKPQQFNVGLFHHYQLLQWLFLLLNHSNQHLIYHLQQVFSLILLQIIQFLKRRLRLLILNLSILVQLLHLNKKLFQLWHLIHQFWSHKFKNHLVQSFFP